MSKQFLSSLETCVDVYRSTGLDAVLGMGLWGSDW